jgi:hypothetical protein
MIKGEALTPYLPHHSGKEEYIEFPNELVQYDVQERKWKTQSSNSDLEKVQ